MQSYSVNIIATDNEEGTADDQKSTQIAIKVVVEDKNDNNPRITNINNDTLPVVLENAVAGHEIFDVEAADPDENENGLIEYSIIDSTNMSSSWFEIDSKSGQISVAPQGVGKLQYGYYFLTVEVSDGGNPPKTDTKSLKIFVQDINSHDPVFTNPLGPTATIQIREVSSLIQFQIAHNT